MSRADWSFLEQLLVEGQENSTGIGRVWLTVLFLFRILALSMAAESAWDDEQSSFICNTRQPGCKEVCYDQAFPVSHFRYFVLQVIFVSTPTVFYFGYVAVRARKVPERSERGQEKEEEEEKRKKQQKRNHGGVGGAPPRLEVIQEKDEEVQVAEEKMEEKEGKGGGRGRGGAAERSKLKGRLLGAYAFSIVMKLALEVGFILGLWFLYGFVVPARYVCQRDPCPHKVDCYVSRPTEKTIFNIYIQTIAGISVLLNILELLNLLQRAITQRLEKDYRDNASWPVCATHEIARAPSRLKTSSSESTTAPAYEERAHQYLPALHRGFPQTDQSWAVDVGVRETVRPTADMLPTYLSCISGIKPLATNHINKHHQQQQQQHHTHKHSKRNKHGHHKGGDPKHRHYV